MADRDCHQPEDAHHLSERLAFIDQGRVITQGPVVELLNNPQEASIRQYLGLTES